VLTNQETNMQANITRRKLISATAGLAALGSLPLASRAMAQSAPDSLRIICGFAPGGTSDTISRRTGDRLAGTYAKSVVVENRAGAGGRIAIEAVKAAAPDGTTLLLTPGSMLFIYPHIYRQLSYNPFTDLTPVSTAANIVHGLAVGPAVPDSVKTVPDFIAWCKANPGKANYGSPAAGSTPHFIGTMVEKAAGVPMTHVGFKGTQLAIVDMMGGQIPAVIGPDGEFLPHIKSGRVRMLATSGPRRSQYHPDVPTFVEQGLKQIMVQEWFGFFMPPKTPAEIVTRAANGIRSALRAQTAIDSFNLMGMEAASSTPAELATRLKSDFDFWLPIVKSTGFTADN
jgi:tripartite-type tricarboxylate transporter receptor subunit TctC